MTSKGTNDSVPTPAGDQVANQAFTALARYGAVVADLPRGSADYDYHMSFRGFKSSTRKHAEEMLNVIDCIGRAHVTSKERFPGVNSADALAAEAAAAGFDADSKEAKRIKKKGTGMLEEQRQILVLDLVDSLLEAVDSNLDEACGEKMKNVSQLNVQFGSGGGSGDGEFGHYALKNRKQQQGGDAGVGSVGFQSSGAALRHQSYFSMPVDNDPTVPFKHLKYPLRDVGADFDVANFQWSAPDRVEGHPYKSNIENLVVPKWVLQPSQERGIPPLESTPLVPVETLEQLKAMILDIVAPLSQQKSGGGPVEIAIDLEHHNQHSFQGYTCLMQLSTRSTDYIVDVISLRDHLHLLNQPVLLEPRILKVLHGANEDIRWLQKDFGCYIVNMFDTGIALQCLQMPHGLGFAVDHFCSVKLDKKYQTADWRLRPLPGDYIQYARMDTHFLLYCYDRLKQLLLNADTSSGSGPAMAAKGHSSNLLMSVLNQSKALCLTSYAKPVQDQIQGYKDAMGRSLGGLNAMQMKLVKLLYNWRDQQARTHDESPPSVMHASSILQLACKAPTNPSDILKAASPVSAILRRSVPEVAAIILAEVQQAASEAGTPLDVLGRTESAAEGLASPIETGTGNRSYLATGDNQRFARHMPMTGTLPSIEANFSAAQATSKSGASTASRPSASSWMGACHWVQQQNKAQQVASSRSRGPAVSSLLGGVSHPVDLPMCLLKVKRVRPAAAVEKEQQELEVEEDTETRVVGQRAERDEAENQQGDEEREVKRPRLEEADQTVAPPSAAQLGAEVEEEDGKKIDNLRAAFKGLGRDTRRREATASAPEGKPAAKKPAAKKGGKKK